MMNMERVSACIAAYENESLNILKALVHQRSTSPDGTGIEACAGMVKNLLEQIGFTACIYETELFPIVYGEWLGAGEDAPVIIYYGHFDTMPADPEEEWQSPPYDVTVRDGRIYGRGTADNKGLLVGGLMGFRAWFEAEGRLPVNVKVVIDGEEERGSPSIRTFIAEHKQMLKGNLVLNIDGGNYVDAPVLLYGVRGAMTAELKLKTASLINHSGLRGNIVPEASNGLVRVLGALWDENGNVAVPGFYDGIAVPSETDWELVDALPYDPETLAGICGVEQLPYSRREYYNRLMFEPTLTINGMGSGYQGEGGMMCIPPDAFAKISSRLVMGQDPEEIFSRLKDYVQKLNPQVEVILGAVCPPSRTDTSLPLGKTVQNALEKVYGVRPYVVPSDGGTAPDYIWTKTLGVPSLIAPLANEDCHSHGVDENLRLDLFHKVPYAMAQILYELSR